MAGFIGRIYKKMLDKHFLLVQSAQTGVLMGVGDVIAQTIIENKGAKHYEIKRTLRFMLLGSVLVGPTLTTWYRILAKHVGEVKKPVTALKKVACDQLLFAPTFLVVFITSTNLLHGQNVQHIKEELRVKYLDILSANYKIWPAVQIMNFYIMPLQYQVLVVQMVALMWNVYLSWKTEH